jgi:hypothetical protein
MHTGIRLDAFRGVFVVHSTLHFEETSQTHSISRHLHQREAYDLRPHAVTACHSETKSAVLELVVKAADE